ALHHDDGRAEALSLAAECLGHRKAKDPYPPASLVPLAPELLGLVASRQALAQLGRAEGGRGVVPLLLFPRQGKIHRYGPSVPSLDSESNRRAWPVPRRPAAARHSGQPHAYAASAIALAMIPAGRRRWLLPGAASNLLSASTEPRCGIV